WCTCTVRVKLFDDVEVTQSVTQYKPFGAPAFDASLPSQVNVGVTTIWPCQVRIGDPPPVGAISMRQSVTTPFVGGCTAAANEATSRTLSPLGENAAG